MLSGQNPQSDRQSIQKSLSVIPEVQLSGSLSDLPSAFKLARDRRQQDISGKLVIYSHPAYWRAQFDKEISQQVGKAKPPEAYHEQNEQVIRFLSKRGFADKYSLHESNLKRFMHISALTGMDLILTIPCKRTIETGDGLVRLAPIDGGKGHFSNWLALALRELRGYFPDSLNSPMRFGRIAFFPTNSRNGKICSTLLKLMDSVPELKDDFLSLTEELTRGLVIPGGGLTHACAQQTFRTLGVNSSRFFPAEEILYTDDPNETGDGGAITDNGLFLKVFPSILRKARINDFLGKE